MRRLFSHVENDFQTTKNTCAFYNKGVWQETGILELLADNAGYIGTRDGLSNKDVELQHAAQRRPTENARAFVRGVVEKQCARQFPKWADKLCT